MCLEGCRGFMITPLLEMRISRIRDESHCSPDDGESQSSVVTRKMKRPPAFNSTEEKEGSSLPEPQQARVAIIAKTTALSWVPASATDLGLGPSDCSTFPHAPAIYIITPLRRNLLS